MASLYVETLYSRGKKTGTKVRVVAFTDRNGKRQPIRLGSIDEVDQKLAESYEEKIERLSRWSHAANQELSKDLVTWLGEISDPLHAKLAKYGLCVPRQKATPAPSKPARKLTVVGFVESYIDRRGQSIKESTRRNLKIVQGNLEEFFGNRTLDAVTEGDADEFRDFLAGKGLGVNTVRRRMGRAKQFFRAAARKKLIDASPFADQADCHVGSSADDRIAYVSEDAAYKVLEACPSLRWRAIFALARFGGLRTPSEHLQLRVADVDWTAGTFVVHSPKTERYQGKALRYVPIFERLRPYLEELYNDAVAAGRSLLLPDHAPNPNANWRTTLLKIVAKAGLTHWPKTFIALRSSCATDLAGEFGEHVAARWLGHDVTTARKHYHQTPAHLIEQATGRKVAQRAVAKTGVETQGIEGKAVETAPRTVAKRVVKPAKSRRSQAISMTPTGLAKYRKTSEKTENPATAETTVADSVATRAENGTSQSVVGVFEWQQMTLEARQELMRLLQGG